MLNLATGEYFGNSSKKLENTYLKLCITNYAPETTIATHNHENPYLSLLIKGSYLEESQGTVEPVLPGEVLYRPGGHGHKNYFEEKSGSCFNIEFKPKWYEFDGNKTAGKQDLPLKFKASKYPFLYKLFINFKTEVHGNPIFEDIYDFYSRFISEKPRRNAQNWVKNVVEIINDEIEKFHSLDELSHRVHVHPVYLSRVFKEQKGLTVSEFQLRSKIERGLHLLLNTSKSIGEISFEMGFYDDAHFIRSFKSIYAVPPARFKRTLNS